MPTFPHTPPSQHHKIEDQEADEQEFFLLSCVYIIMAQHLVSDMTLTPFLDDEEGPHGHAVHRPSDGEKLALNDYHSPSGL